MGVTNSYPWEMGNTDHQGLMRKHLDARQKANSVGYGRNPQETPSSYESMMMFNNERQISRGRRSSHNVSTLPSRSASHDPGSYFRDPQFGMMYGGNPNVQYSDITSVPSSQNGDIGTSNASDVYPIYRRARSSPPRITDIPSSYLIDNDKLMRNHVYPEDYNNKAPVDLSSNSSSGNEEKSAMTMAAVSAERCTDWVSDSTECIKQNDLRNDNHYSLKDAGDTGSPSSLRVKRKELKGREATRNEATLQQVSPALVKIPLQHLVVAHLLWKEKEMTLVIAVTRITCHIQMLSPPMLTKEEMKKSLKLKGCIIKTINLAQRTSNTIKNKIADFRDLP